MKRLFLAVDLDETTRASLASISAGLAKRLQEERFRGGVSWVRAEHLHLTVHFFGNVSTPVEEQLRAALRAPLSGASFSLSLEQLGVFPSDAAPRVLWLDVKAGAHELAKLYDKIGERLDRLGMARDQRPFRPHLTLARFREPWHRIELEGLGPVGAAGPSRVDCVTLYESRLSSAGPSYAALMHVPLQP